MTKTIQRDFEIRIPTGPGQPPSHVKTIQVEVFESCGEEFLTPESSALIESVRARYMGLMSGDDIKAMRKRLGLSQSRLTALLQCGDKSLSRWENGSGYPTGIVNTILRLLDEGFLAPASLEAVQGPRSSNRSDPKFNKPVPQWDNKTEAVQTPGISCAADSNELPLAA